MSISKTGCLKGMLGAENRLARQMLKQMKSDTGVPNNVGDGTSGTATAINQMQIHYKLLVA